MFLQNFSLLLPFVSPHTNTVKLPNISNYHLITILSIDGGGVRGIIPATMLSFLESQLQVIFVYQVT